MQGCSRRQAFVLTPMFYLMSLGLVWLDLHVIKSHSATAHAHTHTLQYRAILIQFFAWLVCQSVYASRRTMTQFSTKEDVGAFICVHFCIKARMWAYVCVWSEVCRLKQSAWGRSGSPVRESCEENSADVVPLSDNSQIVPSEKTAGYELHEKA